MLVIDCHNNKNKIQISPLDSKTAFLILFYVVRTQKLRHLISSLGLISHLLFRFIVSFSLLWSYTWYGDWEKKVFHLIVSKHCSTPGGSSCSWLLCGEMAWQEVYPALFRCVHCIPAVFLGLSVDGNYC